MTYEMHGVNCNQRAGDFKMSHYRILQIYFPGRHDKENLKEISWETFFERFDSRHLAFLYQERTATGEKSRFNKFIKEQPITPRALLQIAA